MSMIFELEYHTLIHIAELIVPEPAPVLPALGMAPVDFSPDVVLVCGIVYDQGHCRSYSSRMSSGSQMANLTAWNMVWA